VSFGGFRSDAIEAGGIANDPPLRYRAIHIIVRSAHLILTGVVDSQKDADIAMIQANLTSVCSREQLAGAGGGKRR
jgi:hypothetical protein